LREALAAADHDFIMVEPRSTKPRRKAAPERKSGRSGPRKKARYASIIASGLSVAMVAGILINALALQRRVIQPRFSGGIRPRRPRKKPPMSRFPRRK